MKLTTATLTQWFNQFNTIYWNGKLPLPTLKISKSSYRSLGRHQCKRFFDGSTFGHIITIYTYYERDEKNYQQTLLHEMCHLYVAITYGKGGHGYEWKREAERINRDGWDISRTTDLTEEGIERRRSQMNPTNKIVAILECNENERFICCLDKKYRDKVEMGCLNQNPKFFEIVNPEVFDSYPSTGRGRTLTGHRCTINSSEYEKVLSAIVG